MNNYFQFDVLISSLRCTSASLSEEKLSISHVEMVHARRAEAWSVYAFGLASPTMIHQPIEEGGDNEDFFGFCPPLQNLCLGRWVEARVVGWGQ